MSLICKTYKVCIAGTVCITKTDLVQYIENFTTKKGKFLDKKF